MKGLQISSWMERDQKAQTLCQLRIQRNFWPLSHDSAASHRADPCQYYQATLLAGGTASYLASLYLQSPINFGFLLQPCHQLCEFWQTNSVRVTSAWGQFLVKFQVLVFSCKNFSKIFIKKKKKGNMLGKKKKEKKNKVQHQWRLALGEHTYACTHPQISPQISLNTILF